ncbi:MAG: polysaccharide pyruvyl transferase family protein [Terriglobales bacterium]
MPTAASTVGEAQSSLAAPSATHARMKVFFVGDNRGTVNWGRGASIALDQLLSTSFEIAGRVKGDFFDLSTAEAGYVGTLFPRRYYRYFKYLMLRHRRWPIGWYIGLEQLLGARDFINEDPALSIDNLLAYKHRYPALAEIYDQATEADLMVLDGDGDIIFSTPPRRSTLFLLAMIELGIRLRKPVFLVNSMISDCPTTGRNNTTLSHAKRLLAQCRAVALRDPESQEYAQREMPETNSTLIPDSLFAWFSLYQNDNSSPPSNGDFLLPYPERKDYWGKLDFSQPYICIGGGALASSQPDRSVTCYGRLVDAIRQLGYRVYLTENDWPDSFLREVAKERNVGIVPADAPILMCGAVVAHARLFISGRYHPSIFASLGGTPCIFMGSHAHKMGSLSRVLEYDVHREFDAFPADSDIAEIVITARRYLDQGETLRVRIRQVAKLRSDEASQLPAFLQRHMNG